MQRPMPPETLGQLIGSYPVCVTVCHELPLWVTQTLLNENSPLYNHDHEHLREHMEAGNIGFLWAAPVYVKAGMHVLGQCELLQFRAGGWQKARQEQQFMEWFGMSLPSWIITLSAGFCASCTDREFCALVDHELYHIAQAIDEYGAPKFRRDDGLPVLTMRGHDVEEFNGVVRRYGLTKDMQQMFEYTKYSPELSFTES